MVSLFGVRECCVLTESENSFFEKSPFSKRGRRDFRLKTQQKVIQYSEIQTKNADQENRA
jgi:hypothetical protein